MRLLFFLLCFLSLFPLSAEAFLSNALGQDLGPIEALTGTGFEGEREEGRVTIYHDGSVIRERIESADGYTLEYGDTLERVLYNEDGERREWSISTPDREEVHQYFYEDGTLSSVSVSVDGNLEKRIIYLETPQGSLSVLAGSADAYISPSFYLYESDGNLIKFSYHPGGPVIRENLSDANPPSYEIEADGSWKETVLHDDGSESVKIYDASGLLVEEQEDGIIIRYEYDDEALLLKRTETAGTASVEEFYENGHLASRIEMTDGVAEIERHYLDTGEIEEIRYSDGVPEYRILFDGDGLRVKEIERL